MWLIPCMSPLLSRASSWYPIKLGLTWEAELDANLKPRLPGWQVSMPTTSILQLLKWLFNQHIFPCQPLQYCSYLYGCLFNTYFLCQQTDVNEIISQIWKESQIFQARIWRENSVSVLDQAEKKYNKIKKITDKQLYAYLLANKACPHLISGWGRQAMWKAVSEKRHHGS